MQQRQRKSTKATEENVVAGQLAEAKEKQNRLLKIV